MLHCYPAKAAELIRRYVANPVCGMGAGEFDAYDRFAVGVQPCKSARKGSWVFWSGFWHLPEVALCG